jgi:hypothetical protein
MHAHAFLRNKMLSAVEQSETVRSKSEERTLEWNNHNPWHPKECLPFVPPLSRAKQKGRRIFDITLQLKAVKKRQANMTLSVVETLCPIKLPGRGVRIR